MSVWQSAVCSVSSPASQSACQTVGPASQSVAGVYVSSSAASAADAARLLLPGRGVSQSAPAARARGSVDGAVDGAVDGLWTVLWTALWTRRGGAHCSGAVEWTGGRWTRLDFGQWILRSFISVGSGVNSDTGAAGLSAWFSGVYL